MKQKALYCALLSALLMGCSSDGLTTYPVAGAVTLDGAPVQGAGVMFMPVDGPPAAGTTDAEGKYVLTTGQAQGAVPGPHKVMITLMKTSGVDVGADGLEGGFSAGGIKNEFIVPEKYSKVETSGLTADVGPDQSEHNFALSSK